MAEEVEQEVIDRARTDRSAFGDLYDFYLPHVYAFCRAHVSNGEDAQDMTAQTFERALAAIERYETRGSPFSAWLLRIAAHLVTDLYRRRGRAVVLSFGEAPIPEPKHGTGTGTGLPEVLVEQWEQAGWLLAHVAALPPDQQEAITLRFWHDRSVPDVAQRMDRSEAAVRQLLHRGIKGLRLRLEHEAMGDA